MHLTEGRKVSAMGLVVTDGRTVGAYAGVRPGTGGWRSNDELVVDLDEGTMICNAAKDAWRKSGPARLGKGNYERRPSPGGTHIAYFGHDCPQAWGGFLWLARSDGSGQSQPDPGWRCRTVWRHDNPRWSPDGVKLLVVTAEPKNGYDTRGHTLSVLVLGRPTWPRLTAKE